MKDPRREVHKYMFKKYEKICNPDLNEARQSIEEFLGQNLVNTLSRCPQDHTEVLTGAILPLEIRKISKDQNKSGTGPARIIHSYIRSK